MSRECPYCGGSITPEEIRSIATHPELTGDPVLASPWPFRFLPVQFTRDGLAIDPMGSPTDRLACPRCRCEFPRTFLRMDTQCCMHTVASATTLDDLLRCLPIAAERLESEGIALQDVTPPEQPLEMASNHDAIWLHVEHARNTALLVYYVSQSPTHTPSVGTNELTTAARLALQSPDAHA